MTLYSVDQWTYGRQVDSIRSGISGDDLLGLEETTPVPSTS